MDNANDNVIRAELAQLGLTWIDGISWNDGAAALYESAIRRGEGLVAEGGAPAVSTGRHTGRSPNDKFIVRDEATQDTIW